MYIKMVQPRWTIDEFRELVKLYTEGLDVESRLAEIKRLSRINFHRNFFITEQHRLRLLESRIQYVRDDLEEHPENEEVIWGKVQQLAKAQWVNSDERSDRTFIIAVRQTRRLYTVDDNILNRMTQYRWAANIKHMLRFGSPFSDYLAVVTVVKPEENGTNFFSMYAQLVWWGFAGNLKSFVEGIGVAKPAPPPKEDEDVEMEEQEAEPAPQPEPDPEPEAEPEAEAEPQEEFEIGEEEFGEGGYHRAGDAQNEQAEDPAFEDFQAELFGHKQSSPQAEKEPVREELREPVEPQGDELREMHQMEQEYFEAVQAEVIEAKAPSAPPAATYAEAQNPSGSSLFTESEPVAPTVPPPGVDEPQSQPAPVAPEPPVPPAGLEAMFEPVNLAQQQLQAKDVPQMIETGALRQQLTEQMPAIDQNLLRANLTQSVPSQPNDILASIAKQQAAQVMPEKFIIPRDAQSIPEQLDDLLARLAKQQDAQVVPNDFMGAFSRQQDARNVPRNFTASRNAELEAAAKILQPLARSEYLTPAQEGIRELDINYRKGRFATEQAKRIKAWAGPLGNQFASLFKPKAPSKFEQSQKARLAAHKAKKAQSKASADLELQSLPVNERPSPVVVGGLPLNDTNQAQEALTDAAQKSVQIEDIAKMHEEGMIRQQRIMDELFHGKKATSTTESPPLVIPPPPMAPSQATVESVNPIEGVPIISTDHGRDPVEPKPELPVVEPVPILNPFLEKRADPAPQFDIDAAMEDRSFQFQGGQPPVIEAPQQPAHIPSMSVFDMAAVAYNRPEQSTYSVPVPQPEVSKPLEFNFDFDDLAESVAPRFEYTDHVGNALREKFAQQARKYDTLREKDRQEREASQSSDAQPEPFTFKTMPVSSTPISSEEQSGEIPKKRSKTRSDLGKKHQSRKEKADYSRSQEVKDSSGESVRANPATIKAFISKDNLRKKPKGTLAQKLAKNQRTAEFVAQQVEASQVKQATSALEDSILKTVELQHNLQKLQPIPFNYPMTAEEKEKKRIRDMLDAMPFEEREKYYANIREQARVAKAQQEIEHEALKRQFGEEDKKNADIRKTVEDAQRAVQLEKLKLEFQNRQHERKMRTQQILDMAKNRVTQAATLDPETRQVIADAEAQIAKYRQYGEVYDRVKKQMDAIVLEPERYDYSATNAIINRARKNLESQGKSIQPNVRQPDTLEAAKQRVNQLYAEYQAGESKTQEQPAHNYGPHTFEFAAEAYRNPNALLSAAIQAERNTNFRATKRMRTESGEVPTQAVRIISDDSDVLDNVRDSQFTIGEKAAKFTNRGTVLAKEGINRATSAVSKAANSVSQSFNKMTSTVQRGVKRRIEALNIARPQPESEAVMEARILKDMLAEERSLIGNEGFNLGFGGSSSSGSFF